MPCTATVSPARAPLFRIELKVVTPAQRRGPASRAPRSSGMRAAASWGTTAYSAYPPSRVRPVIWARSQLMKSPLRQAVHTKQWPPCHPTPTRSPGFHSRT